jgi:hypothetical protein
MQRHSIAWRALLLAVWLLGALIAAAPVARAADAITVTENSATNNFPTGVEVRLSASSSSTIEKVELLYTLAATKTEQLTLPKFTPANSVQLTATAPLGADYVPAGIDVTYHWRLEDSSGAVLETKPQTILWEDTRFSWKSVSSDYVTIYSYKASSSFQKYMLDVADTYAAKEMKLYGLTTMIPVKIWIYDSKADFQGTFAPNSQEWAAGSALPAFQLVQEYIADGDKSEANRLIPHELSHQLLHQATDNPFGILPLWLDEGLAVNNENVDHARYDAVVSDAKQKRTLVSIKALISEFPIDPNQATLAYAESYSIVRFMRATYGDAKLLDLIHAFKAEMTIDDALKAAYGFDQDGLQQAWLASLKTSDRNFGLGAGHIDLAIGDLLSGGTLVLILAVAVAGIHRLRRAGRSDESAPSESDWPTMAGW